MDHCDHGMFDYFDALERGEQVSKPHTWEEYDARGIYLCRVCDKCYKARLSTFRKDVLTNPSYQADEPIEGDDW